MKSSPFEPEPIEVIAPQGTPSLVRLRKRLYRVQGIVNLWRIDDTWWKQPVSRLYYQLELPSGGRMTIFHDLLGGQWYRQNWTG
jgi:hypothetical protein